MKIMTVLGTRPEVIRLSRLIPLLDSISDHVLIHTGQNYDTNLDKIFFDQMKVRIPDLNMNVRGSTGSQVASIIQQTEALINQHKPDRFLVLGDTNSALGMIMAKRMGIPTYHMEAGNRCYDDRVPEEVNRRIIDHCSDILLPYTERSRQNLLSEGIEGRRIFVTGNPIKEVIDFYQPEIDRVDPFTGFEVKAQNYILVTAHRAENVDDPKRLASLFEGVQRVSEHHNMPAIISVHPRTRKRIEEYGFTTQSKLMRLVDPIPFFEFIKLEQNAFLVITDSGTVQEECAIFGVPNVTIRDNTERPETIEGGVNILSGVDPGMIFSTAAVANNTRNKGSIPPEYLTPNVSSTVAKIIAGYH